MSIRRISFNQLCFPHSSLEEDVLLLSEAEVRGIGLYQPKLETATGPAVRRLLAANDLRPTSCLPSPAQATILPTPRFGDTLVDLDRRVEMHSKALRWFGELGGLCYVCGTGPAGTLSPAAARSRVVEMLQGLGDVAAEAGICIAVEPFSSKWVGFATLVWTLEEGLELVRSVAHPNVKLMFDPWHLWDSANLHDLLSRYVGDLAPVVHVSDVRDPTRSWADRLVPGTGIAALPDILATLVTAGFDGWYDLEILSDDGTFEDDFPDSLWKLPEADLLARGLDGMTACWPD